MNREPRTCAAVNLGEPCGEPATMLEPVRLCDEHKVQVALRVSGDVLSSVLAEVASGSSRSRRPLPSAGAHLISSAQSVGFPSDERHGSLVYFLANGGRVKIGYTKNLVSRLRALSLRDDAVLLLLQGSQPLERALHLRFGSYRIGDSEWFELAPEVIHFISEKQPKVHAKRSARGNTRRHLKATDVRQARRSDDELIEELRAIVAEHYRTRPGEDINVQPIAKRLRIGRDRCRRLLDQMNVRPIRKAANQ